MGATPESIAEAKHYQHIGAYLRDLRKHYNLRVEDVASRLHIRSKYISALEEGRIDELPGKVYTVGYVHNYAEFLGLNGDEVLAQYEELNKLDEIVTFKIVEPTNQRGMPSHKLLIVTAAIAVLGFILWHFFSQPPAVQQSVVDEVPVAIDQKITAQLIITPQNEQCISLKQAAAFPPCFSVDYESEPVAFLLHPINSILELY